MTEEVNMPRWGLTMKEGKIKNWLVGEGDIISAGQVICEVETEKILQGVESPLGGAVIRLLHPVGTTVRVGQPILLLHAEETKQ